MKLAEKCTPLACLPFALVYCAAVETRRPETVVCEKPGEKGRAPPDKKTV
jgi:hypothetical protein